MFEYFMLRPVIALAVVTVFTSIILLACCCRKLAIAGYRKLRSRKLNRSQAGSDRLKGRLAR